MSTEHKHENDTTSAFQQKDNVLLNAEILEINHDTNTFKIQIVPNSSTSPSEKNAAAQCIELPLKYLSAISPANGLTNPSRRRPNVNTASESNQFFNDHDISKHTVISRWNALIQRSNEIANNDLIDASNTMQVESSQECDAWFLKECPQTQRLCFVLQAYRIWIEQQTTCNQQQLQRTFASIMDLISCLNGYSYKQLMNDFHHLKSYHLNVSHMDATDDIYAYFKKHCTDSAECNDANCRSFSRNTRDREKCRNESYRRQLYFIRPLQQQTKKHDDDGSTVDEAEIMECNVQDLLDTIHSSLIHYDFHDMTLSNKFVTHFEKKAVDANQNNQDNEDDDDDDDDDAKKTESKEAATGVYGFGIAFKYTEKAASSSYFCAKRYANLKKELLQNQIWALTAFEYDSLKAKAEQFISTWNARSCWNARSMGSWNLNYGIGPDSPAKCEHIVVLMSYTNFDGLQRNFKKTYRKNYRHEPRQEVTKRHREIANWASLLDQSMTFFSQRLQDDNARFYHGINCQLKFTQFQAFFLCPTSTTTVPQIAYNFASEQGVVIALSKADTRGPVFLDVSFISDYPKEEERLIMCNNWSFNNIIYNGMSTKPFVKCLKLFQKIINGSFVIHDPQLFQPKYQNILIRMMDNYMNSVHVQQQVHIPSYLQTLFNHFSDNIKTIWINQQQFVHFLPELQRYFTAEAEHQKNQEKSGKNKTNNYSAAFGKFLNQTLREDENENAVQFGKFTSFLCARNEQLELQRVSYLQWKIEGQQLEAFWRGRQIKGDDIKCDICHLLGKHLKNERKRYKKVMQSKKNSQFVFYPLCKQHTVDEDGRFRYGLKLNSHPPLISSFTFRFEFCIPEIRFYDGETMESNGKGAVGDNRFDSSLLKKFTHGFHIQIIISIRSASLS